MDGSGQPILIVEDDPFIRGSIGRALSTAGHRTIEVGKASEVNRAIVENDPSLVILDLCLPDGSGLDLLRTIDLPVIVVSGNCDEADRVIGLELGADDYVSKPFSSRELVARVRSVLRRCTIPVSVTAITEFAGLRIDATSREVVGTGGSIEFTRIEFDLLSWFAASPRQVFTKAALLSNVWGCDSDWLNEATVTEHVRRVRKKLEAGTGRQWIATVWGVGYRFEPPSKVVDLVSEEHLLVANDR